MRNAFTTFQTGTPQVFVDVDRVKAQMLQRAARQHLRGAAHLHGLGLRQRLQHVRPHLPRHGAGRRRLPARRRNVARIRVRNADGQMVPLGTLVTFREIAGPDRVPRYNLFPTVEIKGAAAAGRLLGPGARHHGGGCRAELPEGVSYEWTDLSYQEKQVGRTGYYIFALSVLFVFLALAAQYESWSLPLAIMLIVPMCLLSALFGVWLHGQDINILTQIGFVVLIGSGRQERHPDRRVRAPDRGPGPGHRDGRGRSLPLRLRPILMTSLAFTLGVLPLYFATGRRRGDAHRARHRRVLGHDRRHAVRPASSRRCSTSSFASWKATRGSAVSDADAAHAPAAAE